MRRLGAYIHIPFCEKKCNYCDFYSSPCTEGVRDSYIEALCKHIELEAPLYKDYEFDTVYIGGGTPSILTTNSFEKLGKTIKKHLNLTQGAEFTIEINPGTLTLEKLIAYKSQGVNRLSIGLQSTNDQMLMRLGRIHTLKDFEESYFLARECGFDNVSLDLMYGLPNQTLNDLIETLEKAISYQPEHISAYCLKVEENTPFGKIEASLNLPDEDFEYLMYETIVEKLRENGYSQYEISNFSRAGRRSQHNLKYWLSQEYIGFGPSAHSFFCGERCSYKPSLSEYVESLSKDMLPVKQLEENFEHSLDKMDEYVMLRFRLNDGVNTSEFYKEFGKEFAKEYPQIEQFVRSGHVNFDGEKYFFSTKGFFVSNYILTQILKF